MISQTRAAEIQKALLDIYAEIENDLLINISKRFECTNQVGCGIDYWH